MSYSSGDSLQQLLELRSKLGVDNVQRASEFFGVQAEWPKQDKELAHVVHYMNNKSMVITNTLDPDYYDVFQESRKDALAEADLLPDLVGKELANVRQRLVELFPDPIKRVQAETHLKAYADFIDALKSEYKTIRGLLVPDEVVPPTPDDLISKKSGGPGPGSV